MKLGRQCLWLSVGLAGGMALPWTVSWQRRSRLDERIRQLELAVSAKKAAGKQTVTAKSAFAHLARGRRTAAEIVAMIPSKAGDLTGSAMVAQLRLDELPEAFELAKQEPDNVLRRAKCFTLLSRWAELDGRSALLEMNRLEGNWVRSNIDTILKKWAKHDPAGLLNWLGKTEHYEFEKDPKNKGETYCSTPMAVCQVAEHHPELALDYVLNRPTLMDHPLSFTSVAEHAAQDARPRQRLLDRLPTLTEAQRRKAVSGIFRGWAFVDPSAAAEWFKTLPSEEQKPGVVEVARALGSADPKVAVEWVRSLTGAERPKAVSAVANAWMSIDPKAGIDFAFQHMADRPEECGQRFASWVEGPTEADAVTWLNQQPASPAKDWAIAKYSEMLQQAAAEHLSVGSAYDDPVAAAEYSEAAAQWRGQIQDDAIRADAEATAQRTLKMLEDLEARRSQER